MKWTTFIMIIVAFFLLWGISTTVKYFRSVDFGWVADLDEKSGMRWAESLARDYSTTERYEKTGNLSDHPLMNGGWKYRWIKEGQQSWGTNSAFITGSNQDHIVIQVARIGRHFETGNPADVVTEIVIDAEHKTFTAKTFFVEKLSKRLLEMWTDKKVTIPEKYIPMNRYHGTFAEQSDGTFLFKYYFVSNHAAGENIPTDVYGTFTLTRVNKKMQYSWITTSHPVEPLGLE